MIFLRGITRMPAAPAGYPFSVPAIGSLEYMDFSNVTLLMGENGSGKSTLLEALAVLMRLPALGAADAGDDQTLSSVHPLVNSLRPAFSRRPRQGMFLRAEDFFGYTRRIAALQDEMRRELRRIDAEYADASAFTRGQARMAYAGSLGELERAHVADPDARSHGESFMHMFNARIHPGGLYLLDEPENSLSPARQRELAAFLADSARFFGCQFVLATHSPFLLALPGAKIYDLDRTPAATAPWTELENVRVYRDFFKEHEPDF